MSDYVIEDGVLKKYTGPGGDMVIPEGVTEIGEKVFMRNSRLKSVTLPAGLHTIGDRAFRSCVNLEEVTIRDGLKAIKISAFKNCTSLRRLWLPDSINALYAGCFFGCQRLKELSLPAGIQEMAPDAFKNCPALKQIEIRGDGDATAVVRALSKEPGLERLANMWLRNGVVSKPLEKPTVNYIKKNKVVFSRRVVDEGTGGDMSRFLGLWNRAVPADELDRYLAAATEANNTEAAAVLLEYKNAHYPAKKLAALEREKINKILGVKEPSLNDWRKIFKISVKDGVAVITGCKWTETAIVIPGIIGDNKVAFADNAFGQTELVDVTISEGVTRISNLAFFRCRKLTNVTLPNGLLRIGSGAFSGCSSLAGITIPEGVTCIDIHAFESCGNLTSIVIPESVTSIGVYTFHRCGSLTDVTLPAGMKHIDGEAFKGCPNLTIHAPAGSYAEEYARENNIPFVAI